MRRLPFALFALLPALLAPLAAHAVCSAANPNASVGESTPTAEFIDHGDGTVTHLKTGLTWKRCEEKAGGGELWDGSTCSGTSGDFTWGDALAQAKNAAFAGHNDWRLPSVAELQSIVETCGFPAINAAIFPNTDSSGTRSASTYAGNPAYAWLVNFGDGSTDALNKTGTYRVRLVRGGQSLDSFDRLAADSHPAAFTFTDQTGVPVSTLRTSNTITVAGINTGATISITGGEYQIGSGSWGSTAGTVNNGDTVTVRHTSSASFGTQVDTVLTIGGVSDTFSSSTEAADTTPDAFTFTDQTGVPVSDVRTSNTITVAGINTGAAISITGGEYQIGSGGWLSTAGTVNNGDTVTVRHTSSASYSTQVDTVLTIGGVADTFSSSTEAADTTPDAFSFTDQTGVSRSSVRTSNAITVAGINSAASIGVIGGEYRIDAGSWTSTTGTVNNGQTVTVRHTSSGSYSSTVNTVLTIGGVADTFSSSTEGAPAAPVDGACGSANAVLSVAGPVSGFCAAGYASALTTTAASFTWSCSGYDGGATASCSAPRGYSVTPVATAHGSLAPGVPQIVAYNAHTLFTLTPASGYNIGSASGCGGTLAGSSYTTGAISADCAVSATFIANDSTPDPFAFLPQNGVAPGAQVTSNAITVSGISVAAPIGVSGGEYRIDNGNWTSTAGTVNNGQSVRARLMASGSYGGTASAVVTIGGGSGNFTVTTHDGSSPNPFGFTPVRNAARSTLIESDTVTLSGLSGTKSATVTGGEMSVNGGAYSSASATVREGSTLRVRQMSSALKGRKTSVVVSVGATSGAFDVYTRGGATGWILPLLLD